MRRPARPRPAGSRPGWVRSENPCHFFSDTPLGTDCGCGRPCRACRPRPVQRRRCARCTGLGPVERLQRARAQCVPQVRAFPPRIWLDPSMRQGSCRAGGRRAASLLFIMPAFEAARMTSPATPTARLSMLHGLTDMRSSRVLRLWSASQKSSTEHDVLQQDAALDHPRAYGASGRRWQRRRGGRGGPE